MNRRRHHIVRIAVAAGCLAGFTLQAMEKICFEAESAETITPPMRVVDVENPPAQSKSEPIKGASGNQYLEVPEGAGKPPEVQGDASYTFTVKKDGTYLLWCRVWWPDGCGNSFGISINGEKEFTFGQDGTYKKWHWVQAPRRLKQLDLKAGKNTLKITNREDGAIVDQILLVNHRRYVPVAIEDVTTP